MPLQFLIHSVETHESGRDYVIGVCGADQDIPLGAVFTAISRNEPREYPDGLKEPDMRGETKAIDAEVQSIILLGKEVSVLPKGYAGCLSFREGKREDFPSGWMLESL